MLDKISVQEPSETLKANSHLMKCWQGGHLSLAECERLAQVAIRAKGLYSSIPSHAQRAERDPDYWNTLYTSRVNW